MSEWEERIKVLKGKEKESLTPSDACFILQFLQEHTAPLLYLCSSTTSPHVQIVTSTADTVDAESAQSGGLKTGADYTVKKRLHHRNQSPMSHQTAHNDAGLDLASFDDFPPVSLSRQEKRYQHRQCRPTKRRIVPTRLKPQHDTGSQVFPIHGDYGPWEEPDSQPAFNTSVQLSSDFRQVLKEERTKIREKIVSQRAAGNQRNERPLQSKDQRGHKCDGGLKREKPSSSDFTGHSPPPNLSTQCDNAEAQLRLDSSEVVGITDRYLLNQIAEIYSGIIKGFLVPSVISEILFLLQLLTLTLPLISSQALQKTTSNVVFKTIDDCIYFSLAVMDDIKLYFMCLDKSTLQLLADNTRVVKFRPQLKEFLETRVLTDTHEQVVVLPEVSIPHLARVQFQEGTDNNKNFPNVKAFHAFKKQRDEFYLVLRNWEKHHDDPKWTLKNQFADSIHVIIKSYGEVCSCAYFAKLFLKQLVESCYSSTIQHLGSDLMQSGLTHQLNKMDPGRLIKLTKRFYAPSAGHGPRPPPSFTPTEEFFTDFVRIADSYVFNHHLILAISDEIMQLHESSCSTVKDKEKFFEVLHTFRVLAKFLGFLEFLPYTKPSHFTSTRSSRAMLLDLKQCLTDASMKGHLCLTVPWVVQYLSMMDPQAASMTVYHSTLNTIIDIYKSLAASTCTITSSRSWYLLMCVLGWFHEIPNFPSTLFSQHLNESVSCSIMFGSKADSLDSQSLVSADVLYLCCPFLNDIHSSLAEFAAGQQTKSSSKRKIKPLSISTAIESVDSDPFKEIERQMVDNFFRSHPPHVKQVCEVTAERIFYLVQQHVETCVIPSHVEVASYQCVKWLREKISKHVLQEEFHAKLDGEMFAASKISTSNQKMSSEIRDYATSFCQAQSKAALDILLGQTVSTKVALTACTITVKSSVKKCINWAKMNAGVQLRENVMKAFEKGLRGVTFHLQELRTSNASSPTQHQELIPSDSSDDYLRHTNTLRVFKESCTPILQLTPRKLSSAEYQEVLSLLMSIVKVINTRAFIVASVPSPPQVISRLAMGYLEVSMELATHMVTCAAFKLSLHEGTTLSSGCSILDKLVEGWKLCKSLKIEVCVSRLLSVSAFDNYVVNNKDVEIWQALAYTLITLVCNGVVSSAVVEGLWLCRWQQVKRDKTTNLKGFFDAVSVFLKLWDVLSNKLDTEDLFVPVHFVRLLTLAKTFSGS